jgi:hypothetical protein
MRITQATIRWYVNSAVSRWNGSLALMILNITGMSCTVSQQQ